MAKFTHTNAAQYATAITNPETSTDMLVTTDSYAESHPGTKVTPAETPARTARSPSNPNKPNKRLKPNFSRRVSFHRALIISTLLSKPSDFSQTHPKQLTD